MKLVEGEWVELGAWSDSGIARIAPFDAIELDLALVFLPQIDDE